MPGGFRCVTCKDTRKVPVVPKSPVYRTQEHGDMLLQLSQIRPHITRLASLFGALAQDYSSEDVMRTMKNIRYSAEQLENAKVGPDIRDIIRAYDKEICVIGALRHEGRIVIAVYLSSISVPWDPL